MSQRVESVEHKRPRNRGLRCNLKSDWPSSEGCCHRGAGVGESDKWADKVGEAEDVEAAGHQGAGDTVEGRGIPGYLWAVDGEVGGGWAVATLLDENLIRIFWGDVLGCDLSVRRCVSTSIRSLMIDAAACALYRRGGVPGLDRERCGML